MSDLSALAESDDYEELKTELAICRIGGLFLALYEDEAVSALLMRKLQQDLPDYFHFPLHMTEKKLWFPIFFSHSFEQVGERSNIFHVLGIEDLPEQAEFIQQLQYNREGFKAKPYSLVFWVKPTFVNKLFHAAPDFYHWVFETYDFSGLAVPCQDDKTLTVQQQARQAFLTAIDLYLQKLIWQYEHWQEVKDSSKDFLNEVMGRANLHDYYVSLYCTDQSAKVWLLDDLLDNFLADEQRSFLTLLGDFSTGKTSFSLHYFIKQAQCYLANKSRRIPLFISLKEYSGHLNLRDFIVKEFYTRLGLPLSLAAFQELVLQGRFLVFIDGFDEMASMSDQQETMENFKELTRFSFENLQFMTQNHEKKAPTNKLFMTCRTHYFFTDDQEQEILKADYTVLYRNYATRSNYQVTRINVQEFKQGQIEEYIRKNMENETTAQEFLNIIQDTYNLTELSRRPLLLDMIVKTLPALKDKRQINASDLYKDYTGIWIEREDWRSQMTPEGKRQLMWELAVKMYQAGGDFSMHYTQLKKPNPAFFKKNWLESIEDDYFKYEVTTCSFLHRDLSGNYKFIHKSFMEYFLAEYYFECKKNRTGSLLKYSETNDETKFFIKMFITAHSLNITH